MSMIPPPIETEGSPVSTAADDATEALTASCQDGFVWVVHARAGDVSGVSGGAYIGEIERNGANRILNQRLDNTTIRVIAVANGVSQPSSSYSVGVNEDFKIAILFDGSEIRSCVNGGSVKVDTLSDPMALLTDKAIGENASGGNQWLSTIYDEYMDDKPENWTDADLQAATS